MYKSILDDNDKFQTLKYEYQFCGQTRVVDYDELHKNGLKGWLITNPSPVTEDPVEILIADNVEDENNNEITTFSVSMPTRVVDSIDLDLEIEIDAEGLSIL